MKIPTFLMLVLCAATFSGCRSLDPAGVYQGDQTLYRAEATIADAYDVVHGFLSYEYAHRDAVSPQVTAAADTLRRNYPKWHQTAIAAVEAYRANPTPDNAMTAQKALAVLAAAVTEAATYTFHPNTP